MFTSMHPKVAGVLVALIALLNAAKLLLDGDPATNPDWASVGVAVMAAYGLLRSRQNNVSSEQAGIK